jgi:hypothetical protein
MSRSYSARDIDPDAMYSSMHDPESPNPLAQPSSSSFPAPLPSFNPQQQPPNPPEPSLRDLMQILMNMQGTLQDQQQTIHAQQTSLTHLQSLANNPSAPQISHFTLPVPPTHHHVSAPEPAVPATSTVRAKGNKPEIYTGKREHTKSFLDQCRLYFRINPMTEIEKVGVAASYLRGSAFTWFMTYENQHGTLATFKDFDAALTLAFGQSDRAAKAKMALDRLRQTNSASAYSSEFNRLIADAEYSFADPKILIDAYEKGLKMEVRKLMLAKPTRDTITGVQQDAMECDNRLFQLSQQQRRLPGYVSNHRTDQPNGPTPMEIDALTHGNNRTADGKLTQEEKDRRKRLGLCIFDGIADCPGKDDTNKCPNVLKKKSRNHQRPNPGRK